MQISIYMTGMENAMETRIFWAGDSTVKQNNYTSFPQTGIGQAFSLFIKQSIRIENYAQNGRSTKSFIDENRLAAIEKRIGEGDFLFIQFGHNDEKIQDPARYTESYGSYQENLKKFIDVARQHGAHPVLITPLYRRKFNADGKTLVEGTHKDYPQAMIDLGKRENVPVIDLCTASKALIEQYGDEATRKWFMHVEAGIYPHFPEGKEDDTHLQYEGAFRFGKLIAEGLEKLGGIYADLLIEPDSDYEDPALLID